MGSIWICIQTIRISCICLPKRSYISDNGGGGWLELLNDYDMSVIDHPCKANVVANALSHMTMGSVSHVEEAKKDLVNMFIVWLIWVLDWKILQVVVLWSIITPNHLWWLR